MEGFYGFPVRDPDTGRYNILHPDNGVKVGMSAPDTTAAIKRLIATLPVKSTLWFPSGTYNIDPFTINRNISFIGENAILRCAGKSGTHITITPTLNPPVSEITDPIYTTFKGFTIYANAINPPAIGQNCILIDGFSKMNFSDLIISGFTFGYGMQFQNTQGAGNDRTGINVSNCQIRFNSQGIVNSTRGEYVNFTNCAINHGGGNNGTGVVVGAGNVSYSNCTISGTSVGISLIAGVNDSHGIFTGCQVNHNIDAVVATGITLGHSFRGCHFYAGNMTHTNCVGINYRDCIFSPQGQLISFTNCFGCDMIHNKYADANKMQIKIQPEGSVYMAGNIDMLTNRAVQEMNPDPIPRTYFAGYFNGYA